MLRLALEHVTHTSCRAIAFVLHLIAMLFIVSSPSSSLVGPETDADAAGYNYIADDQPLLAELPGKQNPLDHSYIAHSFSLVPALDFATVVQKLIF